MSNPAVAVGSAGPSDPERAALSDITYRWDRLQGLARGILEVCWQTVALLVAIRFFHANEDQKSLIASGQGIGMLLSLVLVPMLGRLPLSLSKVLASLWLAVAAFLLLIIAAPNLWLFLIGTTLAQILVAQSSQLATQLYATNYRPWERGRRVSAVFIVAAISSIIFGYVAGEVLDWHLPAYPFIFLVAVVAALVTAYAYSRIPTGEPRTQQTGRALSNLSLAWRDRTFGLILVGWMFMGLGNLMMLPLRVEYLANPIYNMNVNNAQVALILNGVTNGCRLLSTWGWGILFDRYNMVYVRVSVNMLFALSVLLFFFTHNLWFIALGAGVFGIAQGGGNIIWTLWVTKIAPPEKVGAYMSVHGFSTGLRATVAPFFAYWAALEMGMENAALLSMGLIVFSTIFFLPMRRVIDQPVPGVAKERQITL